MKSKEDLEKTELEELKTSNNIYFIYLFSKLKIQRAKHI